MSVKEANVADNIPPTLLIDQLSHFEVVKDNNLALSVAMHEPRRSKFQQLYLHINVCTGSASQRYHIHTYLPNYLPTYLPTYLLTYLPTYLLTYLPTYLPTYLSTYLATYLPSYLHFLRPSLYLSHCVLPSFNSLLFS